MIERRSPCAPHPSGVCARGPLTPSLAHLRQVADLLEPRIFTEQTHEWVAVHNRIQRGQGSE